MNIRALLLTLCLAPLARAGVKLPAIFSEHMVLQRDAPAAVWGWAAPGEEVSVSIAGQKQQANAGKDGRWSVTLDPIAAGGPHTLVVKGWNKLKVEDVLVGDLWLGAGQSNMWLPVKDANNAGAESAAADLPGIRLFSVESRSATKPQADCGGRWIVCSPDEVGDFSATLFFFGRELHRTLGVPVGLIQAAVGGTPIESWISAEAQASSEELKPLLDHDKATGGGLFNGMIAPLIPCSLRGAVWYQGESNTLPSRAAYYRVQLPLLIEDWRRRWGVEFPFAWAQLPNFDASGFDFPTVREGMLETLALPNTGMAVTIDIGEATNLHPGNKQEVGRRLALWALGDVYGLNVPVSGPLPAGHAVQDGCIIVNFSHTDGGLIAAGGEPRGFIIAGADGLWHPAQAWIFGGQVLVWSTQVGHPVAVRYGWENNPACNLYNGAGLPASPFRTDDWR